MTEVLSEELKKLHTCQTERMKLKKKDLPKAGPEVSGSRLVRQESWKQDSVFLAASLHVKQLLQLFRMS